jgi:hypothetical protein
MIDPYNPNKRIGFGDALVLLGDQVRPAKVISAAAARVVRKMLFL